MSGCLSGKQAASTGFLVVLKSVPPTRWTLKVTTGQEATTLLPYARKP